MSRRAKLIYRACAGIVLINRDGLVFSGKRIGRKLPKSAQLWQWPQGGIGAGETPQHAALRELAEETGVTQARIIYELPYWVHYDLPRSVTGRALSGRYRGQRQKWFAAQFTGTDEDINLNAHKKKEFQNWHWRALADCPPLVVSFKRHIYDHIATRFAPFCAHHNNAQNNVKDNKGDET